MLARGMPVRRRLGDRPGRRDPRARDRRRAERVRARALALSLRAIVRYYHGQTPDAVRLGEEALAEVGDAPRARATVLCRTAFLVAQLDLARAYELVEEALRILEPLGDDVDPDLLANVLLLHASAALGLVKGIDAAEIERGHAAHHARPDGRGSTTVPTASPSAWPARRTISIWRSR